MMVWGSQGPDAVRVCVLVCVFRNMFIDQFQEAVAWSAVGAALAVAIVGSCLAMDLLLGWAHMTPPGQSL